MKRLLLHCCCAPCLTYPAQIMMEEYDVTFYFFNSNIHPIEEYNKRLDEFVKYTCKNNLKHKVEEADFKEWFKAVKGLENSKEGQDRCFVCYKIRMEKTAQEAKEMKYDAFSTVLTVSPHKNAKKINEIGSELADQYQIKFIEKDFKKNNGFKIACELSKSANLFRQDYCGCKFSIRNKV